MERAAVLEQVAAELAHIPIWPGEYQGMVRAIYQMLRANALAGKAAASASDVLRRCFATVRRDYPDARVEYDRVFFNG
jgi:hypothetical protein